MRTAKVVLPLLGILLAFPIEASGPCGLAYARTESCSSPAPCTEGYSALADTHYRCDGSVFRQYACVCSLDANAGHTVVLGTCDSSLPPDSSCSSNSNQNGCVGDGCKMYPIADQPQCSCTAQCSGSPGTCDAPVQASCKPEDIDPKDADEICGDGLDNDCNGEIDDDCDPPDDKQPVGGEPPGGTCSDLAASLSHGTNGAGEDPIQLGTRAAVTEPFTDFSVEAIVPLSIARTYTSADASVRGTGPGGIFGRGWHHDWELAVTCSTISSELGGGFITTCRLQQGLSGSVNFVWNRRTPGLGSWAGETWDIFGSGLVYGANDGSILARRPTGEFILYRPDGREFHFQADCARDSCSSTDNYCKDPLQGGKANLTKVVDPAGREIRVDHDRPSGLLLSLSDALGHRLELRSPGSACNNGLARSLVYDGVTYLTYEYQASTRELTAVRQWSATGVGPVVRSYEYGAPGYTGRGYLAGIRNESGDPIVEFGYDDQGRATSIVDRSSTERVAYTSRSELTVQKNFEAKTSSTSSHSRSGRGGTRGAVSDRGQMRFYSMVERELRCHQDYEGRVHYFHRDEFRRVIQHSVFAPGAYSCSSTSPPDETVLPLLDEWFTYGLQREIASGVFVGLSLATETTRRSALAAPLASGDGPSALFTTETTDYDTSSKPGDPSGYHCTASGAFTGAVPCRRIVSGYTLDAGGVVVPEEHTTFYAYDDKGRLVRTVGPIVTRGTAPAGSIDAVEERSYWPDSASPTDLPRVGRLKEIRRYVTPSGPTLVTSFDYDVFGPYQIIDAAGGVTLLPKDGLGRTVAVATPDGRAFSIRYYDGNWPRTLVLNSGAARRFGYDLRGRVNLIEALAVDPETPNYGGVALPLGVRWSEARVYDEAGNALATTRMDAAGAVRWKRLLQYDSEHRPTSETHPVALDRTARWAYDGSGQLRQATDEEGRVVEFVLDGLGRTKVARRSGGTDAGTPVSLDVARYAYDPEQSSISTVTDAAGRVTSYRTDDFGRMLSVESPATLEGGGVRYRYDARGNVLARTFGSTTATYTYDGLDRLKSLAAVSTSGAPAVSYTFRYDETPAEAGRLTSISGPDGATSFTHDQAGRVRFETVTPDGGPGPLTTEYRYDADGNLDTIVYPSGRMVKYEIDAATGAAVAVRNPTTGTAYASGIEHLPQGPVSRLTFGNGTTRVETRNARYEPLSIASGPLDLRYTVAPAGDLAQIDSASGSESFTYDFLDRLTARKTSNGLRADPLDLVYRGGRMIQAVDRATGKPRYAYGYDEQASLSAISTYDATGTGITSTVCLVHDALGRVAVVGRAVAGVGGPGVLACRSEAEVQEVIARFRYDAFNRRTGRKDGAGAWSAFVFSGGSLLSELVPDGNAWSWRRDYVWLESQPLAQVERVGTGEAVYYFHVNHLGAPAAMTNATGQTVWSAAYLPYGEVLESVVSDAGTGRTVVTNLRLPGQYDERLFGPLGLQGPYYNWNRWYLPGVGRYLEADPIALRGGFNGEFGTDWYSYANQNPMTYTDTSGTIGLGGIRVNCEGIAEKINNLEREIARRQSDLWTDPSGGAMPEACEGDRDNPGLSKRGHRFMVNRDKANVAYLKALFANFCKGPPPFANPFPVPLGAPVPGVAIPGEYAPYAAPGLPGNGYPYGPNPATAPALLGGTSILLIIALIILA